jgi:hypothetical protein
MPSAAPSRCRDPAKGRTELLFRGCGAARACASSCLRRARRHDPSVAGRSGSGDADRAVRQALIGLWVPPDETELRPPRWHRVTPARSGPTNGSDSRRRLVVHRPPALFPPTGGAVAAAAPPQVGDVQACRVNRPWQMRLVLLSPLRVFLPIND